MTKQTHSRRDFLGRRRKGRGPRRFRHSRTVRNVRFCDTAFERVHRRVNSLRIGGAGRCAGIRFHLSRGDYRELPDGRCRRRDEVGRSSPHPRRIPLRKRRYDHRFRAPEQARRPRPYAGLVWRVAGVDRRDRRPGRGGAGTGRSYQDGCVPISRRHPVLGRGERAAGGFSGKFDIAAPLCLDQTSGRGLSVDRAADDRRGGPRRAPRA